MDSWKLVLRNTSKISIQVERVHTYVAADMAFVTCEEHIDAGDSIGAVAATNVFALQDGQWRIVHHHGGGMQRQPS